MIPIPEDEEADLLQSPVTMAKSRVRVCLFLVRFINKSLSNQ